MSYILQWGVLNSQYAGDFGDIEFQTPHMADNYIEALKAKPETIRYNDDGDVCDIHARVRRAESGDSHLHHIDCDCGECGEASQWIETIDGLDWVIEARWYLRPDA